MNINLKKKENHEFILHCQVIIMHQRIVPQNRFLEPKAIEHLIFVLRIQTQVIKTCHDFLHKNGLIQLMPVIVSPITDPLSHSVYEAQINYLEQKLHLTKSMIFHKQIAIAELGVKGIFIVSPNIRLEKRSLIKSKKHLIEFSQLDIELKEASARDFMSLIEELICHVFSHLKKIHNDDLRNFGVNLRIPQKPFKKFKSWDLKEEFGEDYESIMSFRAKNLFWITDFEREFYDKEDSNRKGHYINYDLIYPEGFGEALSGGERDYEYEILVKKIRERGQKPEVFQSYLELARKGKLIPSSGGGLGIERLLRYICKVDQISNVTLFPKVPGEKIIF